MMVYKTKVTILCAIIAGLVVVYAGSLVFDPDLVSARDAAYAWLEVKSVPHVDGIELKSANGVVTLIRKNAAWFVPVDGQDYPAKERRVEDFLNFLSKKDSYPVRGAEAASHERLGLLENGAARITVRDGATPLLDLLVGNTDASANEVYLRKAGKNEARSGALSILNYVSSVKTAWYNLRLFPETEKLTADDVQRMIVTLPPADDELSGGLSGEPVGASPPVAPAAPVTLTFVRSNGGWTVNGQEADAPKVEAYIRAILDAEGDDFVTGEIAGGASSDSASFNEGRIVLEFGDGTSRVISVGAKLDSNNRYASISRSPYVYSLAGWVVERLFKAESEFKK
ncbi:MAG: DUF4340 domain-containing protein [Treponema sp.]|jgi:hypothetical protein|nr:DUF4340 domain-containing protein [Treponema sp.]